MAEKSTPSQPAPKAKPAPASQPVPTATPAPATADLASLATVHNGQHDPAPTDEDRQDKIRFAFVEILFGLTMTEIALQIATLVAKTSFSAALPAYAHLTLAFMLVVTSWLGWKRSTAPGNLSRVQGVFEWPFIILLLDVALVVCYFIFVRGVEAETENGRVTILSPRAADETLWLMIIFCGYLLWDFLTKAVMSDAHLKKEAKGGKNGKDKPQVIDPPPSFIKRLASDIFWERGRISVGCVILAALTWIILRSAQTTWSVVWTDGTLLALIILFRALKQYQGAASSYRDAVKEGKNKQEHLAQLSKTRSWAILTGVIFACAYLAALTCAQRGI